METDSRAVLELQNLVDALGKVCLYLLQLCFFLVFRVLNFLLLQLAARPGSLESLKQLVEIAKNPSANVVALPSASCGKEDNFKQSKEKEVFVTTFSTFP